ncbi:MAG TPA: hypothetical protein DEB52_16860 [Hyphomonas sp.]|nr:hypothetical protein [Hyphomonas sp.]HBT37606.1 hypothetical protein [Hyphomonas sp.]
MADNLQHDDSFQDDDAPKSAAIVLDALAVARTSFEPWWRVCDRIDRIIDATGETYGELTNGFSDQEFDLYWASLEIIKPATYSRPPQPVVSPKFPDRNQTAIKASELLERCLTSSFDRSDFDQVMLGVRDDLCTNGRGAARVYYETDDGKRVCDEHVDRTDFLHEPARKWSEVGWVAFAAYLSRREFEKRFPKADIENVEFNVRRDDANGYRVDTAAKCKVWEVWHKADNRVYWVSEGAEDMLDDSAPFLSLEGFFPCPRPAYGTLKRRQLMPVPDYVRYQRTLEQINELTRRVHALLSWIKVKGLIPGGGDVGSAIETALSATGDDDVMLIPIPSAALMQGSGQFVQFLPLQEFASAITGLLDARRELIQNFYELSGISDIMRGATDAGETLGAQQLKSQFGSVRVREKIDELQRVARDVARIKAEIIAEKFSAADIQDMAQMKLPTRAELKKQISDMETAAEAEMDALEAKAMEVASQMRGQQPDPEQVAQAEQQFEQAQQQIIAKYQPMMRGVAEQVPIEDVMDLLRDQKARAFAIDIETDSTIMVDEMAEKQSRAEFLTAFSNASVSIQPLLAAGESGATLAGGMIKFALAPYRAGRELDGMIDDFIETAPSMMGQQGEGDDGLAAANMKLAEAETIKAQAAMENVKAKSAKDQADMQGKLQEMQIKASKDQQEGQLKVSQLQMTMSKQEQDFAAKMAETDARVNKMQAETAKILESIGLDARKQELEEYRAAENTQAKQVDQAMSAQDRERQAVESERSNARADRGEDRQDMHVQQPAPEPAR